MKILVVDDSADKVGLLKALIAPDAANDELEIAQTGLEAREALSKRQFDLLIVDIAVPLRPGDPPDPKGGMNLLVELERSARFYKPANVLALTGYTELRAEFEAKFNNGVWNIDLYDASDSGWRDRLQAKLEYLRKATQQSKIGAYERDVCIITALQSPELDFVRRLPWSFGSAKAMDHVTYRYSGSFSSSGRSFSVDAVSAPRMGMVAAATLASKVVQTLRLRVLVMAGICAGVPKDTELGDVILADPTWDWQMGKYTLETFEIQPDQVSCPVEVSQRFAILRDDRHALLDISDQFAGEKPAGIPSIKIGPLASGSAVIATEEMVATVRRQNRKLIGFDMEMYGVYSALRDLPPPRPIVFGLKGVCDHADHYKNDKYQAYASHVSASVLRLFLERFYGELTGT